MVNRLQGVHAPAAGRRPRGALTIPARRPSYAGEPKPDWLDLRAESRPPAKGIARRSAGSATATGAWCMVCSWPACRAHDVDDPGSGVFLKALGRLRSLRDPARSAVGSRDCAARRGRPGTTPARRRPSSAATSLAPASHEGEAHRVLRLIRALPEAYRETLALRTDRRAERSRDLPSRPKLHAGIGPRQSPPRSSPCCARHRRRLVSDRYLWDKSGPPDAEVERMETLLADFAHQGAPLELPAEPPRIPVRARPRWTSGAGDGRGARGGGGHRLSGWEPVAAWLGSCDPLSGAPRVAERPLAGSGRVAAGEWLVTDASSSARVTIGTIGVVDVGPSSRVRVIGQRGDRVALALERGALEALIWPRRAASWSIRLRRPQWTSDAVRARSRCHRRRACSRSRWDG